MGGVSIWQLLIVLVIVVIIFGTKRLRNIGSDLGGAIKSFRGAMQDGGEAHKEGEAEPDKLAEPQGATGEDRKESKDSNRA